MLLRAIGLTFAGGWVADRQREGGLEDVVNLAGWDVPTVQLGGWMVPSLCVSFISAFNLLTLLAVLRDTMQEIFREVRKFRAVK